MTTFPQNLEPLIIAAEKYAEAVKDYENRTENDHQIPQLVQLAKDKLAEAAIEFAKWGNK